LVSSPDLFLLMLTPEPASARDGLDARDGRAIDLEASAASAIVFSPMTSCSQASFFYSSSRTT
jgi:hypothetical protein